MPLSDAALTQRHPTLASSCAVAASAAEARYRISYPEVARRNSRVIALDAEAAAIVRRLAGRHWSGGHFLVFETTVPGRRASNDGASNDGAANDGASNDGASNDGASNDRSANGSAGTPSAGPADALLRRADGTEVLLSDELSDADVVVMLAAVHASAEAASVIGDACAARSIMSAGLVVPGGGSADAVVSALRPNAMVLVILQDGEDVPEILSALRV